MKSLKEKLVRLTPRERLYQVKVPIIGLTGGIGTGKSSVASILKEYGLLVLCADTLVKRAYQANDIKNFVRLHYPEAISSSGTVDFPLLRSLFFNNPERTKIKEELTQKIYDKLPELFLEEVASASAHQCLVYDVPLLFENNLEKLFDHTTVVYAPKELQIKRVQLRDKSDLKSIEGILEHQLAIDIKAQKADSIIHNKGTLEELSNEVERWVKETFYDTSSN